jgi:hypothetical protein
VNTAAKLLRLPVDGGARPELHVTLVFPGSLEQSRGIRKVRAQEEAHVHVCRERIDVFECRVAHARGGMAVVEHLTHVDAALTHALVPSARDSAELARSAVEPCINRRVSLDRTRKAH